MQFILDYFSQKNRHYKECLPKKSGSGSESDDASFCIFCDYLDASNRI